MSPCASTLFLIALRSSVVGDRPQGFSCGSEAGSLETLEAPSAGVNSLNSSIMTHHLDGLGKHCAKSAVSR